MGGLRVVGMIFGGNWNKKFNKNISLLLFLLLSKELLLRLERFSLSLSRFLLI